MKKLIFLLALIIAPTIILAGNGGVVLGDEQFSKYMPLLKGKRVAIFSNQSGIVGDKVIIGQYDEDADWIVIDTSLVPLGNTPSGKAVVYGPHILDVMLSRNVNVTAIFSPEHGFRGTADPGETVNSSTDEKTGVPILSLYEKGSHIPSAESMSKFDVLLVDIQDVGLRYYTYYITMHHLMEACSIYGKKVIILDRPNPNGFYVDGPILDMKFKSGIGWLPIPIVHGMTLGELGLMINGEGWLDGGKKCDLTVIPCLGYTHQTKYRLIMPPSPNLKDMKSIYLYPSTCFFEGTVVTPGRGTEAPFEIYGSPDMSYDDFNFTPTSMPGAKNPRYMNEVCYGVDLRGLSDEEIWAEKINLGYIIDAYKDLNIGDKFFGTNNHFDLLIGNDDVRKMIEEGKDVEVITASWKNDVDKFLKQRRPYLLYKE